MGNQMDVVRAKLARIMAAKKQTDGVALHREELKEEGRRESEAARRAEEAAKAAKAARREARRH
ncbi:hypothetical protein QIS99_16770 [Streptomyces sp. B-S-A8]|uniref:CsbD family protein n=1 Tax=Streptomyces solicavernae TaxID=3043614 RepID=A0ABT6RU39_9ACTN|nr:hypothetical protein [Streptomyces sp. B-S-A8]MDI3387840.1 hypothetical protein [Streptomyces sp. B-S-A8]